MAESPGRPRRRGFAALGNQRATCEPLGGDWAAKSVILASAAENS
jgi:hypothetical protein